MTLDQLIEKLEAEIAWYRGEERVADGHERAELASARGATQTALSWAREVQRHQEALGA